MTRSVNISPTRRCWGTALAVERYRGHKEAELVMHMLHDRGLHTRQQMSLPMAKQLRDQLDTAIREARTIVPFGKPSSNPQNS